MKKCLTPATLTLVLLLATVSTVSAEGIHGTGELHAWGDGLAGVRGDCEITVSGNGVLYFRDHEGDATFSAAGFGERRDLSSGWIVYFGFNGTFEAQGSRITVALSGYDIDLWAEGTGVAILFGEGGYETRHGDDPWSTERLWPSEVEAVRLNASE